MGGGDKGARSSSSDIGGFSPDENPFNLDAHLQGVQEQRANDLTQTTITSADIAAGQQLFNNSFIDFTGTGGFAENAAASILAGSRDTTISERLFSGESIFSGLGGLYAPEFDNYNLYKTVTRNDSRALASGGLSSAPILPIEFAIDGAASIYAGIESSVRDFGFFSTQTAKIGVGIAGEVVLDRTIGKIWGGATDKIKGLFGSSANDYAKTVLRDASRAEPEVTALLSNLSNGVGGRLEGLEFVLKSESSLVRKISSISEKNNLSLLDATGDINDALRYTMILDANSFGDNINSVFKSLEGTGHKKAWLTNTFLDQSPSYKGINATFKTPNGQPFELQFHTADSFNVKQNINHSLYESARLLTTTKAQYNVLNQQMISNSAKIPQPQGINLIPNYKPGY